MKYQGQRCTLRHVALPRRVHSTGFSAEMFLGSRISRTAGTTEAQGQGSPGNEPGAGGSRYGWNPVRVDPGVDGSQCRWNLVWVEPGVGGT